jgi:uncharacterized LabA/DUF88 family protein
VDVGEKCIPAVLKRAVGILVWRGGCLMSDRCAIFIDGGYLEKLTKNEFNSARIDFSRFASRIAQNQSGEILRIYYYHCLPYQHNPPLPDEKTRFSKRQNFYSTLERLPRFQVRLGKLEYRGEKKDGSPIFEQKRVDMLIGIDMVLLSATRQIETAILVAGDSDYIPAIEIIKQHGVLAVLWHGPRRSKCDGSDTVHQQFWDIFDERRELTQEIIDSVLLEEA